MVSKHLPLLLRSICQWQTQTQIKILNLFVGYQVHSICIVMLMLLCLQVISIFNLTSQDMTFLNPLKHHKTCSAYSRYLNQDSFTYLSDCHNTTTALNSPSAAFCRSKVHLSVRIAYLFVINHRNPAGHP